MLTEKSIETIFNSLKNAAKHQSNSKGSIKFQFEIVDTLQDHKKGRSPKNKRQTVVKSPKRQIWSEKDYIQLLVGSFCGLSRQDLATKVERSAAKVFSKLQKHVSMIAVVESALVKS